MRNLLSALGIIFFGILMSFIVATSKPKPAKKDDDALALPVVQVMQAEPIWHAASVQTYGVVKASRSIDLQSEVAGKVIWVDDQFIQGGKIKANQPFIKINKTQYQAKYAAAKAGLQQAKENLAKEEAQADQAKKEWRDLGSTSANDLFLRKPQLASARAQIQAAETQLKEAAYYLAQTDIQLNYDAVIVEPRVFPGQFIATGKNVATLYSQNQMQVTLPLTQKQLAKLNLSWPLSDTPPQIKLVTKIGGEVINLTGSFLHTTAEIDTNNQLVYWLVTLNDERAIPGLYVEADVTGVKQADVYEIPETALFDQRFVITVDAANQLDFKTVTILDQLDSKLFITSDQLSAKDWIVTERMAQPFNGMTVEPTTNMPLAKGAENRTE